MQGSPRSIAHVDSKPLQVGRPHVATNEAIHDLGGTRRVARLPWRASSGSSWSDSTALRRNAWQRFHSVIGRVALALLKTIGKVDDGVTDPWAALSAQHGFDFSRFEQRLPGGLVLVSTESLTV